MNRFVISILLLIQTISVVAQKGSIKGMVTDAKTQESLIGTTILLKGTSQGTITDFDGNYLLPNINAGNYTLVVSFISYDPQEFEIEVKANEEIVLNVELSPATLELAGVEVVAKANRESENMLLVEQKNALLATQAIGAQEISRKGISDAEGAVAKVSGVNKQDGVKNVFVRGLGDRYNSTSLNGFPVPSEDPEYKNISLEFFSSDVIKAVGVKKAFNSEMIGDVGGAVIDISSKELVGSGELSASGSWGMNTATMGKDFLVTDGNSSLGFAKDAGSATATEYGFKNKFNPSVQNFRMNQAYNVAGGSLLSNEKMSFYLVGAYNEDYFYNEGTVRKTATTGRIDEDKKYKKYISNTSHLLMGNYLYNLNRDNVLSYSAMYIHTNKGYFGEYVGYDAEIENRGGEAGDPSITRRQQINDNTLLINQLSAELKLTDKIRFNPGVSLNYVKGSEPDRRVNNMFQSQDDGLLRFYTSQTSQQRFDSDLNELDLNLKAVFNYSLSSEEGNSSSIDFGYNGRIIDRDFKAIIYGLELNNKAYTFNPENPDLDQFFNQDGLGGIREAGTNFYIDIYNNTYTVKSYVHTGFVNATYQFTPKLVVSGGVRMDLVNTTVDYKTVITTPGTATINKNYLLPSLNSRYSLADDHAIRLGLSKTYTLPQAKEMAPFEYVGETFSSQGNPDLQPSENYNVDVKYDYYISTDELLSVGGFYKHIKDPISRLEEYSAAGYLTYRNIADYATAAGLEVELRKNIFKQAVEEQMNKLSLGVNASYIYSLVQFDFTPNKWGVPDIPFTDKESALEGAAPFILNSDISYNYRKSKTNLNATLVLNYTSDKLYTVGTSGFKNTIEKAVPTLDFIFSSKFASHWGINAKFRNLLNPSYELTREPDVDADPVVLSNYKKGLSLTMGVSYNF
ncbi:Outer membrane receptor proteins, mostly Fe transport [Mariniphaga anaerophila]|uniref:Outer membrane receptor proteins, mostly Fe transport n=1 Tax=Mariniphaga anaerophila TaxID=1484053 RepID=A0A1M5BX53_9BACT|nr:TonB-dependent receptor [Mariniphaga anaerophila]SHF46976.1 Outer membrane receptor proteins, mostly Fe transport [Mariniphaga anaerophila]